MIPTWTYDPTTPLPMVVVTCYQSRRSVPSQRYRWRARSGSNNRKLANGGEGYSSEEKLYHALELLWPTETTRHVVVKGL
jgi:hypothetical protein